MTELKLPGVERPLTPPEYGAKTAQAVLELIRLHPRMFNMKEWIFSRFNLLDASQCGTTLCVAGWAQWLHEGRVVDEAYNFEGCTRDDEVDVKAAEYLGIDKQTAGELFYSDAETAVAALEYLARGELINWVEIEFDD